MNDRLALALCAAVAEEIRDVRSIIEGLAELLTSDPHLAMTYTEQLQSFDLLIQRAEESAAVLQKVAEGACSIETVNEVRLHLVQDRLRAALKAA